MAETSNAERLVSCVTALAISADAERSVSMRYPSFVIRSAIAHGCGNANSIKPSLVELDASS